MNNSAEVRFPQRFITEITTAAMRIPDECQLCDRVPVTIRHEYEVQKVRAGAIGGKHPSALFLGVVSLY